MNITETDVKEALTKLTKTATEKWNEGDEHIVQRTIKHIFDDKMNIVGKYIFSMYPGDDMVELGYVSSRLDSGDIGVGIGSISLTSTMDVNKVVKLAMKMIEIYDD